MISKYFFVILVLILFSGCSKDTQPLNLVKPVGCDSTIFSYNNDIKPIISAHCFGSTCHSGGNSNYDYTSYEVLADRIRSGRLEQRLLEAKDSPLYMPQGGSLDDCELFTLRTWIHQGFKNN
jgi:hypothetical protein